MRRKLYALLLASTLLIGVLVFTATAVAIPGYRLVASRTVTAKIAVAQAMATVNHPKGIAIRLSGRGNAHWDCFKGVTGASWSKTYRASGFYTLPHVRGWGSCKVLVTAGGSRRAVVQIYERR